MSARPVADDAPGTVLDPRCVRTILVRPRSGGNVGSAARAMKNLGFDRLVLVDPACDGRGAEARRMAVDAGDLLERAVVCPTLDVALEGATTVVGTSRRTGKHRRPHWRLDALAPRLVRLAAEGELAVLFGREDHGLSDAELDRCTHLVHLPSSAAYPSFNLAQAVLLVAYELRLAATGTVPASDAVGAPAADGAREAMFAHLERALDAIGFLNRDGVEPIMRRIRRMLGKAELTGHEVRLLRGLARQMLWVAERGGGAASDGRAGRAERDSAPD